MKEIKINHKLNKFQFIVNDKSVAQNSWINSKESIKLSHSYYFFMHSLFSAIPLRDRIEMMNKSQDEVLQYIKDYKLKVNFNENSYYLFA